MSDVLTGPVEWIEGKPHVNGHPISHEHAVSMICGGDMGSTQKPDSAEVNTKSGGGAGRVVAFVAAAAVGIWGVSALLDDKPPPRTNKTPAAATTTISPPLVKGAYYKVGYGHGVAFVDGGNELLKREFSTKACIVVTDPMPLMGTPLVKIDLPQPGLNNIPAYVDGRRLQYAPECYERRM